MKKLVILLFLSIIFIGCYPYGVDSSRINMNKYKFNYRWNMFMNYDYVSKITNKYKNGGTFIDDNNNDTLTCIISSVDVKYYTRTEIVKKPKYYNDKTGNIYEYVEDDVVHSIPLLHARKNDSLSVHIYSTFNTSVVIHLADSIYTKTINIGDNVFYFNWSVCESRTNIGNTIWIVNDALYSQWLFYTPIAVDF